MKSAYLVENAKLTVLITHVSQRNNGRGFISADLNIRDFPMDPFITATDFQMSQPFFPPHPHAGVSVLTYIFEDSKNAFINRDSHGDHSRIEPGGLHLTQAGIGIQHEEIPEVHGVVAHGLQLWLNHSAADRLVEARSFHAQKAEVPQIVTDSGGRVRVLLGQLHDTKSTITPVTPVTLLDVHVTENEALYIPVPQGELAWLLVIKGNGTLQDETPLDTFDAVSFAIAGDHIHVKGGSTGLQMLVGMGKPLQEENIFSGPFVMSTPEQLHATKQRYGRGEMGALAASVPF
jgi:quercetin 2,3-dioxygenase